MKLFNKDGKLFDICEDAYIIGKGCFGDVHVYDNQDCIKLFRSEVPADPKVMEEIKNLKLHHFDSLKEILYDDNGNLKAYIMTRYRKGLPDYYSSNSKEFVKVYKSLYKDVLELTDRKIYLGDMKPANTMNYKGDLKIVDYDYFEYSKSPKLRDYNNEIFLRLWENIMQLERVKNGYKDLIKHDYISPLFQYDFDNSIVSNRLDILKDYNLVIDYFMELENGKRK